MKNMINKETLAKLLTYQVVMKAQNCKRKVKVLPFRYILSFLQCRTELTIDKINNLCYYFN